jgi:prepilin-type N-terminal cleavage/methylation domain-containing protein
MTTNASMMARRTRRRSGMSMIEMMAAVAILGFGILAAASSQLTAMKFTRESQLRTEAYYLAAQQMEAFQAMTASQVADVRALSSYPNDVDNNPIDPDTGDSRARAFNRSWEIEENTPIDGLYTITVTVAWLAGNGAQSSVEIESVKVSS